MSMRWMAGAVFAVAAMAQVRSGSVVDTNVANVANLPAQKIAGNDLIGISVYDAP
jgi:hypothetical protein